jgi:MFS family permease
MKRWSTALFARFRSGLLRDRDFATMWGSMTITSFGAQITNLALPLTAALLLHATPFEMGLLIALETLPFALIGLFAGVWVDRMRKLPLIIGTDLMRGFFLLLLPIAAWFDWLSMPLLYAAGFVCGVGNTVGGAAYQVFLTNIVGRDKLVEANAKMAVSQSSAELVGPGLAGALIQVIGAPFAITLDAVSFLISGVMLRKVGSPDPKPAAPEEGSTVWREIGEGLRLVWHTPLLRSLAWSVALWQLLHHMYLAVIILFATRELGLSPGSVGLIYAMSGTGCLLAALWAQSGSDRFGVGPVTVYGLLGTAAAWQVFALTPALGAWVLVPLSAGMLLFGFAATVFVINYLSLRQAITPDHLMGRMTATMRFLTVAIAPVGSLVGGSLGSLIGLRGTLLVAGALGLALGIAASGWSVVRRVRRLPTPEFGTRT